MGSVEIEGLEFRYAPELDPAIQNMSLTIRPREKIGVVCRSNS